MTKNDAVERAKHWAVMGLGIVPADDIQNVVRKALDVYEALQTSRPDAGELNLDAIKDEIADDMITKLGGASRAGICFAVNYLHSRGMIKGGK